jgi:hypothetical protein
LLSQFDLGRELLPDLLLAWRLAAGRKIVAEIAIRLSVRFS